jgi:RNA polymerase sigma factor (sigma-70 family)
MTSRHLLAPARLAGSKLLGTQSDERLVDLMRAGSEPAFEAIVSRYRGPLIRYCSALLGRERAEDAVQQTFVNAYEAMRGDDRPLRLKPWLYRIAHNVAHNALRSGALRDRPLDELPAEAERPELVLERRDRLRAVLASVQALPERQRDAIVLRELEGRSYEEIEAALGAGGGAVRQLLNRARTTLRTAATAVTPVGLLLRLPGSGAAGESVTARVAELTGAAGAGTIAAKVAATALVTGAVAGGAAVAPLGDSDGKPPRERPAAERGSVPSPIGPAAVAPASQGLAGGGSGDEVAGSGREGRQGDSSGPGSGDEDRGDGDSGDNSGPGSDSSGPGSGSSGSGSSGSDSDSSGPSGSGSDSSGSGFDSSGSGSGSSGSASSGSGSGSGLGSGSSGSDGSGSGSGSSGSAFSGTGLGSDSSDSGSSGSGSSGSSS